MSKRRKSYRFHRTDKKLPTIEINNFSKWYKEIVKQKKVKALYKDVYMQWLLFSLKYDSITDKKSEGAKEILSKIIDIKKFRNRLVREIQKGLNGTKIQEMEKETVADFEKLMREKADEMKKKAEEEKEKESEEKTKETIKDSDNKDNKE